MVTTDKLKICTRPLLYGGTRMQGGTCRKKSAQEPRHMEVQGGEDP